MATRPRAGKAGAVEEQGSAGEAANEGGSAPLTSEQKLLFDEGMPMVAQCAREIAARYRCLPRELLGAGTLALHEATRTYDRQHHPSFPVYARHHIRGRMIDAVKLDRPSGRARVERVMERAFEGVMAHHVVDVDLARDTEEKILSGARETQADVLAAAFLAGLIEKQREDAEEGMIERLWLREGVKRLFRHEREMVRLVYWEGKSVDDAAATLGIHPSTAQRRHAAALRKLHALLVEARTRDG